MNNILVNCDKTIKSHFVGTAPKKQPARVNCVFKFFDHISNS